MRTLMAFGDSNTHGTMPMQTFGDRARFDRMTRWPGICAAELGAEWHVIEEGHPGRTSVFDDPTAGPHRNGLAVLPALLETHMPLDIVAMMVGTNDLKACHAMTALDIALAVERLVVTVRTSLCGPEAGPPLVLLIAPMPIAEIGWLGEMFQGGAEKSHRLAEYLAEVAARNAVGFLDAGDHVAVDEDEGIHLDTAGHAALGRAVAAAVRNMN